MKNGHKIPLPHSELVGIFPDGYAYMQKRIGAFWFWEDGKGRNHGGSVDFSIEYMRGKYIEAFSFFNWERAILEVNNKYSPWQRFDISKQCLKRDATFLV